MTSERLMLGSSVTVISSRIPRRTSRPEKRPRGFPEPTASIVWDTLRSLGLPAHDFVLWNVFPWHSFDRRAGMLSNRTPSRAELVAGTPVPDAFLRLFPSVQIVAVGRIAASQLPWAKHVRHPASGGAALFRRQMASLLETS